MIVERVRRAPFAVLGSLWVTLLGVTSGVAQLTAVSLPAGAAAGILAGSLAAFLATATWLKMRSRRLGLPIELDSEMAGGGGAALTARAEYNLLPLVETSFVDRVDARAQIRKKLQEHRLVTLTGVGGCGKTRLATEVAHALRESESTSIYFVDLVPISDSAMVAQAASAVMRLRENPDEVVLESVIRALRGKRALVVLDNCEQVAEGANEFVTAVLGSCPQVRVLATSRTPLRVPGEILWEVAPLGLPAESDRGTKALESPAVRLFVDRAREGTAGFQLNAGNTAGVVRLCRRLDGVPLALEIAAARTNALSIADINMELEDILNWQTKYRRPGRKERETLSAVMAWSHQLLRRDEQVLLRCMAVFAGPVDLASIAACSPGWSLRGVTEALESLVNNSLVTVVKSADESSRYRLLAPVRSFAAEHLRDSGETSETSDRHSTFFSRRLSSLAKLVTSSGREQALAAIDADYADVVAALTWTSGPRADRATAGLVAGSLFWYWNFRGLLSQGRAWYSVVLQMPTEEGEAEDAELFYGAGAMEFLAGALERSEELLVTALAMWRRQGPARGTGYTLVVLGMVRLYRGQTESARSLEQEAVRIFQGLDDGWGLALALNDLGNVVASHDNQEAMLLYGQSIELWQGIGDNWGVSLAVSNMGESACLEGRYDEAKSYFERALALQERNQDRWGKAWTLMGLADVALGEDQLASAEALYRESLIMHVDIGRQQIAADCLVGLAKVNDAQGRKREAALLLGAASSLRKRLGVASGVPQRRKLEEYAREALPATDPQTTTAFEAGGRLTPLEALRAVSVEAQERA